MKIMSCIALLLLLFGCGDGVEKLDPLSKDGVILAFGDSLTYGTGAEAEQAYPAVLEGLVGRRVVNSGVPGETTREGVKRLPQVLAELRPDLVILCEGGNDMLRGVDDAAVAANLADMIATIQAFGAQVVLVGVPRPKILSNTPEFYGQLAAFNNLPYLEETLGNILTQRSLKSDLIHPNAAGYRLLAQEIALLLERSGAVQ